ncbi:HAMP domain-containing histidine kinase [Candidatus Saccharibacteria bacterium]|nr:HAMP domain-containing histidine kinase [Candidatus Saccharibacteria bacterium]
MDERGKKVFELAPLIVAAHELKAPLVLLRQLSLQLARESDPEVVAEIAQRIRLTSERSLRLVNGLSKTARLEGAMFKLEPIVVNNVAHEVITELEPLSTALGQKIEIKTRQNVLAIGHFDLVRTILMGLIDNSLMSHKTGDKPIEVRFRNSGENLQILVRDFGEIIEASRLKSLSSRLNSAPTPLPSRPNSTGLGLFVAAKFSEYMNGGLSVTRHRQGGLTFKVTLPASRQLSLI